MRAIDTNVLVRLLVRDDPVQVGVAEEFVSKGAWLSHLVLAETVWVLDSVHERSATQIATALDMLLNHQELTLQEPDVVRAAMERFRAKPSIDFSDCLLLEIARKAGHLPLGTFDRRLGAQPGAQRL
jgi:predicted nucleic-acid-binding protein